MKHFLVLPCLLTAVSAQQLNVMPLPAKVTRGEGALIVDQTFNPGSFADARIALALGRFTENLARATGLPISRRTSDNPTLVIHCSDSGNPVQTLAEDESYKLTVNAHGAVLDAPNSLGVMHGLETLLQLVQPSPQGYIIPAVTIEDKPRFPWRGLHIDVCRHWMPVEVILRQLDAMAAVKLNVFHWHLTDDQGFRIESKLFPKLQEMGSDGNFYTQDAVRYIIRSARFRGIRVVPEFDMPGHTTAWFAGMPELASGPGPYQIERTWGVFAPTMDPTREATYEFLDKFIGEMAGLFPDEYFHIGGDELSEKTEWNANQRIRAFMKQHGFKNNDALQAYFNKRVQEIVTKHGKRMEGWDEILSPDLSKDIVIQSWRGVKSLADAAKLGFPGILSAPYYLDHMEPASKFYMADPLGGPDAASLTDEQKARILGGEVCAWNEYVTPEIIDGRLWPRSAAVAERFWSPAEVTDVAGMYRRLEFMSRRLEWLGLTHQTNYRTMLQRLSAGDPIEPLRTLADVLRPVPLGGRERADKYTQQTPLNRLVDTALPENPAASQPSRRFLEALAANDAKLKPTLQKNALLKDIIPVSAEVSKLATIGLKAFDYIESGKPAPEQWASEQRTYIKRITNNRRPPGEVVILIAEPIGKLLDRATNRQP